MMYSDPTAVAPAIVDVFSGAERVLLLTHLNPDGDAIGSMLGMWHTLTSMGKKVSALIWPILPYYVLTFPGIENVCVYESGMELPDSDITVVLDTSEPQRIGLIYDEHQELLTSRPMIIIDHHRTDIGCGVINLIDSESASCAEVLFRLLQAIEAPISPAAATCLLLGITTDTQSFQTSSTTPQSHFISGKLIELGANQQFIVRSLYYSTPYPSFQLCNLALSLAHRDRDLIWTQLSQEMFHQVGLADDTGEDIINSMQRLAGIRICVLFKERPDRATKISLRSMSGIDVATIASRWNGGGHSKAAGAVLKMDLATAQQVVITHLLDVMRQ